MVKVRVQKVGDALHPSEIVVAVTTVSGTENLVIDRRSLDNDAIIIEDGDSYLIELPRESQSGSWRVWVNSDRLISEERLSA